jgi:hypothetical protein
VGTAAGDLAYRPFPHPALRGPIPATSPFDPERFNRANAFSLLQKQLDAKETLPSLDLTCGDDDGFNHMPVGMSLGPPCRGWMRVRRITRRVQPQSTSRG